MTKPITTFFTFAVALMLCCLACSDEKDVNTPGTNDARIPHQDSAITKPQTTGPSEDEIKQFLYSKEGTYGWQTVSNDTSYDFFRDGRLHIQGPDGEATMWAGKWTVKGDQLTMSSPELHKTELVTVKIDGDKLVLGDKTYTRYSPK